MIALAGSTWASLIFAGDGSNRRPSAPLRSSHPPEGSAVSDVATRLSKILADRYRVERELGAGGMATVYLAEDLKHRRKVAIKVLRPELAAVIGASRFLREIETIAGLQHPHILGLIDSGEMDGTAYYVMPFIEGESLRDRLNREKQLPITDAVRLATEVAAALDYAHRHGVVHRDIKPENILLHDGAALVADFGIALAASKAGGERMTETGMSLGTPHYMSPEQAMGEQDLDGRADIYALGCVLHEMIAGEPPFTGPTAQAIVAKVMASEPAPLSTVRKTVPRARRGRGADRAAEDPGRPVRVGRRVRRCAGEQWCRDRRAHRADARASRRLAATASVLVRGDWDSRRNRASGLAATASRCVIGRLGCTAHAARRFCCPTSVVRARRCAISSRSLPTVRRCCT